MERRAYGEVSTLPGHQAVWEDLYLSTGRLDIYGDLRAGLWRYFVHYAIALRHGVEVTPHAGRQFCQGQCQSGWERETMVEATGIVCEVPCISRDGSTAL